MVSSIMKNISSKRGMKVASLLVACVSIFLVTLLYYTQNPFLEAFEAKTYDLRVRLLARPGAATCSVR